jgi:hypothetical protein
MKIRAFLGVIAFSSLVLSGLAQAADTSTSGSAGASSAATGSTETCYGVAKNADSIVLPAGICSQLVNGVTASPAAATSAGAAATGVTAPAPAAGH